MSVPYLGKRNPGGLTAANPGDTLFFPFGSYNDSGDSEGIGGTFAVTDVEVFKNGLPTTRATDSGYSLISDTGQLGDRVGLHRFSIQLFNTSDDTGHYEVGAWYQVAVDAVTIDGKTVRFWAGQFEIGTPRADIRAVLGDTGAAHLDQGRFGVISDSGRQAAVLDTGKVASAIWASHQTRTLTAFALDTGVRDTIWRASPSSYTSDTGSFGYAAGRVLAVRNDTGAAHLDQGRFGVLSDSGVAAAVLDTGKVAAAVWASHQTRTLTAFQFDTGVWASPSRTLTAISDTGLNERLDAIETKVTPLTFNASNHVLADARSLFNDTGAAVHLSQAFTAQNTNSDTGLIANAAAIRTQTDKLTFDTGANELHADIRKVNNIQIQGAGDTGAGNTWRPV